MRRRWIQILFLSFHFVSLKNNCTFINFDHFFACTKIHMEQWKWDELFNSDILDVQEQDSEQILIPLSSPYQNMIQFWIQPFEQRCHHRFLYVILSACGQHLGIQKARSKTFQSQALNTFLVLELFIGPYIILR